jgi:hypothetical protein
MYYINEFANSYNKSQVFAIEIINLVNKALLIFLNFYTIFGHDNKLMFDQ